MVISPPATLLGLVIRELDASVLPVVSSEAVARYPQAQRERLLSLGILRERAAVRAVSPCEQGKHRCYEVIHGCPEQAVATCPALATPPSPVGPEGARGYEVQMLRLLCLLRTQNRLGGEVITEFQRTLHFLGWTQSPTDRAAVVLARCMRPCNAESVLFNIRGRLPDAPVLILTPTPAPLDLHMKHHFEADRMRMLALSEARRDSHSLEADLSWPDAALAAAPTSGPEPILVVNRAARLVRYRGLELRLTHQEFALIELLAEKAAQDPEAWVARDTIQDDLWPDYTPDDPGAARQVDDLIHRLRRAFEAVEPGSGSQLIRTRRRSGYRLAMGPLDLLLI